MLQRWVNPTFHRSSIWATVASCLLALASLPRPLLAQAILPAADGTGTVVLPSGDRFDIQGGRLSADGANLFHSFQRFGLDAQQIANFLAQPGVQNILGRVVGGDPSMIHGLLQVSGGPANLYLMNPAGIVFGPTASLNVPGDFFATTASAIGFGPGAWFEAFGAQDYSALVGQPSLFAFDPGTTGAILNAGQLSVAPGQHLALIGSQVASTGSLQAPGGQITVSAVPGTGLVRLSQPGHLLSLEIEAPRATDGTLLPVTPLDLPALLTASGVEAGLRGQDNSIIEFTASGQRLPLTVGTALVAGTVEAAGGQGPGGAIAILGDRVALLNATLEASGTTGGGDLRIGGEYQGRGGLPNASRTYISPDTTLRADALGSGDGGRVILWADDVTHFHGHISARGGNLGGDGGFVEVSGQQSLDFTGTVDAGAPLGTAGTVLLDPDTIRIQAAGADDAQLNPNVPVPGRPAGHIFAIDGGAADFTLSVAALEAITGSIVLHATSLIEINAAIHFQSLNVILQAATIQVNDSVSFANSGSQLNLNSTNSIQVNAVVSASQQNYFADTINFNAGSLTGSHVSANANTGLTINTPIMAGTQTLIAGNDVTVNAPLLGNAITLQAGGTATLNGGGTVNGNDVVITASNNIEISSTTTGSNSLRLRSDGLVLAPGSALAGSGSLTIEPFTPSFDIGLGTAPQAGRLDLTPAKLGQIQPGFSSFTVGRPDGTGTMTIVADLSLINAPLTLRGATTLEGSNGDTTWTLTGASQGNFTTGGLTVSFNNVHNIASGAGDDRVVVQNGVNFGGWVDGGAGFDTLDYSQYTSSPVTVDLGSSTATGLVNAFNFEAALLPNPLPPVSPGAPSSPPAAPAPPPPAPPTPNPSLPDVTPVTPLTLTDPALAAAAEERSGLALNPRAAVEQAFERGDVEAISTALDHLFSDAFSERLGRQRASLSVSQFQQRLRKLAQQTDTQPAMIYVYPRTQQLELILVPLVGSPIRYSVPEAPAERVFAQVQSLFDEVIDPTRRRTTTYLQPAQQLEAWIMEPLRRDLERLGIDTLLFSLDEGLRSLPLAVLHDGRQFLVERYRFSVIPSLTLANLRFTDVREATVLAMGISEFRDLNPLPAVPMELDAITRRSFYSKAVLNEGFTLANLEAQRQQTRAAVVHLATHAEFVPGERGESFIEFWEESLAFEQLATLDWRDPDLALLVLSACRTALGDPEAEYGFAGLAIQAGVDTAIASLWYASDVATLGLMSEFYAQLGETPLKSEALRRAQVALLSGRFHLAGGRAVGSEEAFLLPPEIAALGDRQFQHPYYWAGFSAVGNPW